MAGARLVVVLALASLLVAQAAQTRPSFVEWIKQGTGKVQSAYEEVETESTCLQSLEVNHCRCHVEGVVDGSPEGTETRCLGKYAEVKLGCCESEGYDKYSSTVEELISSKHSVGTCVINRHFFKKPISYGKSDCIKIGTFTGTCELTEKAGECGSPLCEGMTLVIDGDLLRYPTVGFIGSLAPVIADDDCKQDDFLPIVYPREAKKTPAKVQDTKADEPVFLVGQGDIYAGVFSVVSKEHKTSYKTGTFQQVVATGDKYDSVNKPPEKCYIAKDGAASLDFIKSGGNY